MAETNKPEPGPGVQEMAQMAQPLASSWRFVPVEQAVKELQRRVEALERIHKPEASTQELKRERDEARKVARGLATRYFDSRFPEEKEAWEAYYPWLKQEEDD